MAISLKGYFATSNIFTINCELTGDTYPSRMYWTGLDWVDVFDITEYHETKVFNPYKDTPQLRKKAVDGLAKINIESDIYHTQFKNK
jgi:hypothetical protein